MCWQYAKITLSIIHFDMARHLLWNELFLTGNHSLYTGVLIKGRDERITDSAQQQKIDPALLAAQVVSREQLKRHQPLHFLVIYSIICLLVLWCVRVWWNDFNLFLPFFEEKKEIVSIITRRLKISIFMNKGLMPKMKASLYWSQASFCDWNSYSRKILELTSQQAKECTIAGNANIQGSSRVDSYQNSISALKRQVFVQTALCKSLYPTWETCSTDVTNNPYRNFSHLEHSI